MPDVGALIDDARGLARSGGRVLLGVSGAPGAGKSTVADAVAARLGPRLAVVVPMDGFHLADDVLDRLGRRSRKGAPDTFDVEGYVALLQRVRAGTHTVYAPRFHRELEAAVAGSIEVPPDVPLVITEGNYLLLWAQVRELLDRSWYLDPPPDLRQRRLVERRLGYGASREQAVAWATGSDQANAELVEGTRALADVVVPG